MERGKRYAVCDKTFNLYQKEPYRDYFDFVEPREPVPLERAEHFDSEGMKLRHPKETKGVDYDATTAASECCDGGSGSSCC